jgi:hypothetical protein
MIAPPKPPDFDELELLIKEARERQLRRRLLGAASVAIAAAIGLSAYPYATGGSTDVVEPTNAGSASGAVCRSSQLTATSYWNGATGTLLNFFAIANKSHSACSLPLGRPTVLLTWHRSVLPIEERTAAPGSLPGKPLRTIPAGAKAAVYMQWSNWCGRPQARATTTVTLRFSGGLRVAAPHVAGQPPCLDAAQPSVLRVSRVRTLS